MANQVAGAGAVARISASDHQAVDALPDATAGAVCELLWSSLDARTDLAVVVCDARARMVGGSARIEAAGRPLVPGLSAGAWPRRYELRRRPGGPLLRPADVPIVRALSAPAALEVAMYQGLVDDDGELTGRALPLVDETGRRHGAAGLFHRDPLGGPAPPRPAVSRPTDRGTLHLLLEVLRALPAPGAHPDPVVAEVDALLRSRFREPLRLADVAAHTGLSGPHLTTRVRQRTGRTVMQRLEDVRLERAARLLAETSLPVSEIASRTGPWDPSAFARAFKRRHGRSPSRFRGERR